MCGAGPGGGLLGRARRLSRLVRERGSVTPTAGWRESAACGRCLAMGRTTVLAECLIEPYRSRGSRSLRQAQPYLRDLRIHEFAMSGPVHDLKGLPGFSFSERFDGVAPGAKGPGGVRCEDVERLTFQSQTFDLVVSQDVFEHVTDPDAGFREIHRVLRPGGRHVFTVPFDPASPATRVRARRSADGSIEHLHPAAYHLDPIRSEGALVISDFGADLPDRLRAMGYDVRLIERRLTGIPGGYTVVFETVRAGSERPVRPAPRPGGTIG